LCFYGPLAKGGRRTSTARAIFCALNDRARHGQGEGCTPPGHVNSVSGRATESGPCPWFSSLAGRPPGSVRSRSAGRPPGLAARCMSTPGHVPVHAARLRFWQTHDRDHGARTAPHHAHAYFTRRRTVPIDVFLYCRLNCVCLPLAESRGLRSGGAVPQDPRRVDVIRIMHTGLAA